MGKCIVCTGDFYEDPLICLHDMPASAQDIPDSNQLKFDKGITLNLFQCKCCGLVQFDCKPVNYYRDVIRAGGGTSTMINLRQKQFHEFVDLFNLHGKKIVEVGCGQGEFLTILNEFNLTAVGIENKKELIKKGLLKGLKIYSGFIENAETVIPGAPYDAFVQFNFLEHQPDPNAMLKGIYNNLTEDGVGLLTVPSFEYILKYDGFYELIRDHIAYYTESVLKFLMEKNGFEIIQCNTVNRDTLAVLVKKRKKVDVTSLLSNFDVLKIEFERYLNSFIERNKKVAVWGASHQGFTIIPTLKIANKISYIIDSATFKQNKFAPASHVPIVSPEYFYKNPVDAIIIIAPGYSTEISNLIRQYYGSNVEIAILRSKYLEIIK